MVEDRFLRSQATVWQVLAEHFERERRMAVMQESDGVGY